MTSRLPAVKTILLDYSEEKFLLDSDDSVAVVDNDDDGNDLDAGDEENNSSEGDESGDEADDEKSPDDEPYQLRPDRLTTDAGSEQKAGGLWPLIKSLLVRAAFMYFVSVVLQRERTALPSAAVNLAPPPSGAELYNNTLDGSL